MPIPVTPPTPPATPVPPAPPTRLFKAAVDDTPDPDPEPEEATPMKTEPSAVIGAISTAVAAVLALIVAFGIDITDGQQAAILGVIAGVGPVVTGILIRGKVYAPATVEQISAGTPTD